jgi:hypothetical protein
VPVSVQELSDDHVRLWDERVQPVINQLDGRADVGWRWRRIRAVCRWAGALQEPAGFAVVVMNHGEALPEVPCALVQLVARLPALDDPAENAVFLWYLADASEKALGQMLEPPLVPKKLGTFGLDVAVSYSFRLLLRGRTSLHADPHGGERLSDWYAARGMLKYDAKEPRPSLFRVNDGRYFYFTPEAALQWSQELDEFRKPGA